MNEENQSYLESGRCRGYRKKNNHFMPLSDEEKEKCSQTYQDILNQLSEDTNYSGKDTFTDYQPKTTCATFEPADQEVSLVKSVFSNVKDVIFGTAPVFVGYLSESKLHSVRHKIFVDIWYIFCNYYIKQKGEKGGKSSILQFPHEIIERIEKNKDTNIKIWITLKNGASIHWGNQLNLEFDNFDYKEILEEKII